MATALLWILGCSRAPDPKLVYVSAEDSGEIVVLAPESAAIRARIPVGKRPRGLKLSQDGKLLFVALSGSPRGGPNVDESQLPPPDRAADGIGVVDLGSKKLLRTLASGQDPESFDISRDGKQLFVSNEETAQLSVVDVESGRVVRQIPVGKEPEGVALGPDQRFVYVTSEQAGAVDVIDTETWRLAATIKTGSRPRAIVFTPDGRLGFVTNELSGSLTLFDPAKNEPVGELVLDAGQPVTERPMGMAFGPGAKRLFVTTGRGGAVAVINVEKRAVERFIRGVGARPWGIAKSWDGELLVTANGPSNDVSVLMANSGALVRRVKIGGMPWGVASAAK